MLGKEYIWKSFDFKGSSLDLLDLFQDEAYLFLLDSSQYNPHYGRYSFIGFDPFDQLVHKGADTLDLLKKKYLKYCSGSNEKFTADFTPLTSGVIGCLSYDYGLHQEPVRLQAKDDLDLPDCFFGFYDSILTIDHFTQKLYVTSSGLPEQNSSLRKKRAEQRLNSISEKITYYLNQSNNIFPEDISKTFVHPVSFKSNLTKEQYCAGVRKALEYIRNGDIYQVNLSQRFEFDLGDNAIDALGIYRALTNISPAPFGGYINCGNFELICNSPERFLHLSNGIVQSKPMKGTRPRGENTFRDEELRKEIIHSSKDQAELLMITDLLRNDLGRVCDYGSISVKEMRTLEEYKYVYQMTSTIEGVLRKNKDCFDLIRACFPGGSITGCPKIRAMDIIEELEPTRRLMYTGLLGYINFAGGMDFNILIRTVLAYRNKYFVQVGSGIVADSKPENEYEETLDKIRAIRESLKENTKV